MRTRTIKKENEVLKETRDIARAIGNKIPIFLDDNAFLINGQRRLEVDRGEITEQDLNASLSTTVMHDEPSKQITFLNYLLAQTNEDQYNIGFQAESSAGKSYIPEVGAYFPASDIRTYAGASPTSFFHQIGAWKTSKTLLKRLTAGDSSTRTNLQIRSARPFSWIFSHIYSSFWTCPIGCYSRSLATSEPR